MILQKIKQRKITGVIEPQDVSLLKQPTGNIYQSIMVISKRANQINTKLEQEFEKQKNELLAHTDTYEEIQENKEQKELSYSYEQLPSPVLIALQEFKQGELIFDHEKNLK